MAISSSAWGGSSPEDAGAANIDKKETQLSRSQDAIRLVMSAEISTGILGKAGNGTCARLANITKIGKAGIFATMLLAVYTRNSWIWFSRPGIQA